MENPPKIKVILADDHTLVRNGIRSLLEDLPDISIIGEAQNGEEAVSQTAALAPDVVMLDIAMPGMNGIEAAGQITRLYPGTSCLMLSMHNEEDYILKSVEAGAQGYLLKDATREEMLKALRTVARGEKYYSPAVSGVIVASYLQKVQEPVKKEKSKLSKKEKAILVHLVEGANSREIAEKLNLSVRTVDNHRGNMMKRLQVKNAVELVRKALAEKLI